MRRNGYLGLVALISVLLPGFAHAQNTVSAADVRCVIVGIRVSEAGTSSAQRTAGMLLATYYIGRLDGRNPNFDLEDATAADIAKMTAADYASAARRCGRAFQLKGKQITAIGKDLAKRGRKLQKQAGKKGN